MFSFARGILSNVRQSGLAFALLSVRTYKVRSALKLKCPGCKFVRRKGRLRVICKNKNTHKQKQGWWLYFGYFWSQLLSSIIHGIILPSRQSYLRVWIYDWIWTMVLFCTNRLFVIWSLEGKDFFLFGGKDNLIQLKLFVILCWLIFICTTCLCDNFIAYHMLRQLNVDYLRMNQRKIHLNIRFLSLVQFCLIFFLW